MLNHGASKAEYGFIHIKITAKSSRNLFCPDDIHHHTKEISVVTFKPFEVTWT